MHYFINTFGSNGLTSFELPYEKKYLYGYPQDVFRDIVDILSKRAKEKNIKTEFIHSFLNNSIKAIVFPALKKCVYNVESYEDDGVLSALDSGYLNISAELIGAHGYFKEALSLHDEWEKIYIDNINYDILDTECKKLRNKLFTQNSGNEDGKISDRFLGAATAYGAVDFVPSLTEEIKKRYFIKGRPGTGKSTFMKKIANDGISMGYDVERYHCSFDPKSIDMIIIRGLDVCIFDATPPHEHFPERENDEIIDFYTLAAKSDIDSIFSQKLHELSRMYKEKINCATDCIARCNNIIRQNEKTYTEKIDHKIISAYAEKLADII